MRNILRDLYFGNITPWEQQMAANSRLERAVARAAQCEDQLAERLGETERALLDGLVKARHAIDGITACENFILGFRLGVRLMAECMDGNDGEVREVVEHD